MAFDDDLAHLNEWHFFKEFVYSKNTFQPATGQEVELADSLIWLGDTLVAYQLKERELVDGATAETEMRWFRNKILKKGTKQVRDTVAYLNSNNAIALRNHRGDTFELAFGTIQHFQKLIVYHPQALLPLAYRWIKHHRSNTVGIIHIISSEDYLGIVRTLLTPVEVAEYLEFRSMLIERWEGQIDKLPEQALIGQYLCGEFEAEPSGAFVDFLQRLDHRAEDWDMSGVMSIFPDRVTTNNAPTDYYPIVQAIALLKRNELREFKKRFNKSVENAKANTFARPYRMTIPRTGCGFVFIPLTEDLVAQRRNGLLNLTSAHKYEQRLQRCIGITISNDVDGWIMAEWAYLESQWMEDPEMEKVLAENNPFRDVREGELPRYHFRD